MWHEKCSNFLHQVHDQGSTECVRNQKEDCLGGKFRLDCADSGSEAGTGAVRGLGFSRKVDILG